MTLHTTSISDRWWNGRLLLGSFESFGRCIVAVKRKYECSTIITWIRETTMQYNNSMDTMGYTFFVDVINNIYLWEPYLWEGRWCSRIWKVEWIDGLHSGNSKTFMKNYWDTRNVFFLHLRCNVRMKTAISLYSEKW